MSYETTRKRVIKEVYQRGIDDFAKRYVPGRPTLVLLPGGMGSQLDVSDRKYGSDTGRYRAVDPIWMDVGMVFNRDANYLEIQADLRDSKDYFVVPNGPLRFGPVTYYNGTEEFFLDQGYNYIVFGFDWRRSLAEAAENLEWFLAEIRRRVAARGLPAPGPELTLFAHSMGGLVAKTFLSRTFTDSATDDEIGVWFKQFVTVATPFYGTTDHLDRYYRGFDLLNSIYGAARLAKICSTLPGPYTLLPLDRRTYDQYGKALGLERYPVRDSVTGEDADPYDPRSRGRWPDWTFASYLRAARREREVVARPLPPRLAKRTFHIRSVNDRKTAVELLWKPLPDDFDPAHDASLVEPVESALGGDGTVPYWSACLASIKGPGRVYDLPKAKTHHELAEHPETLRAVNHLVRRGALPKPGEPIEEPVAAMPALPKRASIEEAQRFLADVRAGVIAPGDPAAHNAATWRRIIEASF